MEDTFSYVGSAHKVDLEKFSLEVAFIGPVTFKSLKKNGGGFLHSLVLEEDLDNTIKWSLWLATSITHGDHLGEVNSCCWVLGDDSSEDLHEVRLVTSLLAVGKDLVELVGFNESLENSIGASTFLENLQGKVRVVLSNEITKLV